MSPHATACVPALPEVMGVPVTAGSTYRSVWNYVKVKVGAEGDPSSLEWRELARATAPLTRQVAALRGAVAANAEVEAKAEPRAEAR